MERVSDELVSQYGIIDVDSSSGRLHRITRFVEKPKPTEIASRLGVIGKYVLTPDVFDALLAIPQDTPHEIRLADALTSMVGDRPIYGLEIEGTRYDTGSKLGFLKATVDYALEREDIGGDFREFLRSRLG